MDKKFVLRIRELVEKVGGQSALSRKTGLSLGAIQRYLRGGDPSRRALIRLAEAGNVSMMWLVYGRDENDSANCGAPASLPMYGFGDSSEQGWYSEIKYNICANLEWPDPEVFAIVAHDRTMEPEGIKKGQVCIVSPNTRPQKGDVAFIRRKDGTAALKIYEREDSEWCYLTGFMDPGASEKLVPSSEQIKRSAINQIAPVILVKRR